MLVAGWVGLVFSATYLGQRDRSFVRAFGVAASVQRTFAATQVPQFAAVISHSDLGHANKVNNLAATWCPIPNSRVVARLNI